MLTISKRNGIHHIGPTLNSFWKWCSFQWHSVQECISVYPPKTNMELKHTPWKETFIYKPPFVLVSMFVFRCGSHVFIASKTYFVAARPAKTISIFFFQVWSFLMIYITCYFGDLTECKYTYIYLYIHIFTDIHKIIDIHDRSTSRQLARWQVSKNPWVFGNKKFIDQRFKRKNELPMCEIL